jgi:hypothetical protein
MFGDVFNQPGVSCPFCDDEVYAYATGYHTFAGEDSGKARGRYGLDVRGGVEAIEFAGESSTRRWALAFGFHNGNTYMSVARLPNANETDKS